MRGAFLHSCSRYYVPKFVESRLRDLATLRSAPQRDIYGFVIQAYALYGKCFLSELMGFSKKR